MVELCGEGAVTAIMTQLKHTVSRLCFYFLNMTVFVLINY